MSDYGLNYTRMRFSYASGIRPEKIVREIPLTNMEIIYELTDGSKILYDEFSDRFKLIGNTGLDYVTDEIWKKEFSRRVEKMIIRKGLYRKDFAELLGISENTMSRYVTGKSIPNGYLLQRMAEILECDLSYLTDFNYLL